MRPVLHKMMSTSSLVSSLPELGDTTLVQLDLDVFLERVKNSTADPMTREVAQSGLLEAAAFPRTVSCVELVLECMHHYDKGNRCIRKNDGEVLLSIDRQTVMAAMGIPHREPYEDWTIGKSYGIFFEKKQYYRTMIAWNWLLRFQKGGSRLSRPLTREHLITAIRNLVILLRRVKGNSHSFHWED